jgi:hypothetical protein
LEGALGSRVVIEQAKGITAQHNTVLLDQAYQFVYAPARPQQQQSPAQLRRGDRCRWLSGLSAAVM